jgi:hypothetical protein
MIALLDNGRSHDLAGRHTLLVVGTARDLRYVERCCASAAQTKYISRIGLPLAAAAY